MSKFAIFSSLWGKDFGILERFVERHPGSVIVASGPVMPEHQAIIANQGGTLLPITDFIDAAGDETARLEAAHRAALLEIRTGEPAWQDYCAQQGWLPGLGRNVVSRIQAELPEAVVLTRSLEKAHRLHRFNLVVVSEDVTATGRAIVAWSKKHAIPSLQVEHGLGLCQAYTVSARLDTDVTAVYGERSVEGFLDIGMRREQMAVTGNPLWDAYADLKPRRAGVRDDLARLHGLDAGRPWVVFGTTWAGYLSALIDSQIAYQTVAAFVAACADLRRRGLDFVAVVKTRPNNTAELLAHVRQACEANGLPADAVHIAADDAKPWVVAADVLASVDSNLGVEALAAGTPAVNLITFTGQMLGPSFSAHCGVLEALPAELGDALHRVLTDDALRADMVARGRAAAPFYNLGVDGRATERVTALMARMAGRPQATGVRRLLAKLARRAPRRVLDLGCGDGLSAQVLRLAHPDAVIWGVEGDPVAACDAARHLDRVIECDPAVFDPAAAGLEPGAIDTVILCDLLDRLPDPAALLARLRPYLAADCQILCSVANARNLRLLGELAAGRWREGRTGLIDPAHTHLFTHQELLRFFLRAGLLQEELTCGMDPELDGLYRRLSGQPSCDVAWENLVLKDVQPHDLIELCTAQFVVRCAYPAAIV